MGDKNIFRFEIAVDNVLVMRRHQPLCDLDAVFVRLPNRNWPVHHSLAKGLPLQQFRDDIRRASVHADVVDCDNVGVVQRGGSPGFLLKTPQAVGVICQDGL